MNLQCALCQLPANGNYFLQEKPFCCLGCQTVYSMLEERNALQEGEIETEKAEELMRLRFEIEDLFCIYCKEVIEWVLKRTKGIHQAVVDYATDLCIVEYNPRKISQEEVWEKIAGLGYKPKEWEEAERSDPLHLPLGVAAFFSLNIMMSSYPVFVGLWEESYQWGLLFSWVSLFCSLPILLYAALPIFKRAWGAAQQRFLGMEALVSISVLASFSLSVWNLVHNSLVVYFDTLSVLVTLVLAGKWLERKAKRSAKGQMRLLFKSVPKRARVKDRFVLVKDLQEGDIVTTLCGEKIPVDGEVVEGWALLDVALLTGESEPQLVQKGSRVKGGTIVAEGAIHILKSPGKSTVDAIVELVESSLLKKKRRASHFFNYFIPAICLLALFSYDPLAVLLISCPCAIGIAAPLAESKLIDALLRLGILVRNREALAYLGRESHYVFDKTGTLTTKELAVRHDLRGYEPIIKAMADHSIHPVAKALSLAFKEIAGAPLKEIREEKGKGIWAEGRYFLGADAEGKLVFCETGKEPIAIELEDRMRADVPRLFSELNCTLHLYSGDRKGLVEKVAEALHIADWGAKMTPEEKSRRIEALQGITAFVGDGMNDAPAISAATLSFVPVNGSDLAAHSADFLLTKDDLTLIAKARRAALKGQRILRQNLFWAFFYNLLGIPLAFFGLLSPILAALFMLLSSLMVLLNSKRI